VNHIYRVVWNSVMGTWQAVAECARGRGKSRSVKPLLAAALLVLAGAGQSQAAGILPTGGASSPVAVTSARAVTP
jgi:hypothetical protein